MLLMISVDGLLPSHYLSAHGPPVLRRLASIGAFARAVEPVYPSVTYTNHASIATGTYSDRHGVLANTRFDPDRVGEWKNGESQEWYFEARALKALPIWEIAERAGLEAAVLRWPVSLGAEAHWFFPEIWPIGAYEHWDEWELLSRYASPGAIRILEAVPGFRPPRGYGEMDRRMSELLIALLEERRPGLAMIHLSAVDHEIHRSGMDSEGAARALRDTVSLVARILERVDLSRSHVLVFGDHGFCDFTRRVHLNALLSRRGWLEASRGRITSWQAVAHISCGQAAIYVRDEKLGAEVGAALRRRAGTAYRVLGRDELRGLRSYPDAFCGVEALEGYSLGQRLEGELIEEVGEVRGEHGYLPFRPKMMTGFLAAGPGIRPGGDLGKMRVIDIAPTAAALLGLSMPEAEGETLLTGPATARRPCPS